MDQDRDEANGPVWLITGATGFLGTALLDVLRDRPVPGAVVATMGRRPPAGWSRAAYFEADLLDGPSVMHALRAAQPAVIIHLAGKTPPAPAVELLTVNSVATALMLDTLRQRAQPVRVVLAGSAAELGPVAAADLPVGEDHPCRPADAYALSKHLATAAGLAARAPVEVMVGRIFNPIGPGTPSNQALGRFAAELADARTDTLVVGQLDTRRDFIDVRDAARALVALAQRGRPGQVYHVGTGRSHLVRDGLDRLRSFRHGPVRVEVDPALAARKGPDDSRADIRRIGEHTGWTPEVSWEQSLSDLWAQAQRDASATISPRA